MSIAAEVTVAAPVDRIRHAPTVDSWGDGLLVLMPDSAVLTAYGTTPELP